MQSPAGTPVVVRNSLWFRLATPFFAATAVVAWSAFWLVVVRDDGGMGIGPRIIIGLLMFVLGYAATSATLTAPLLKMVYGPDRILARLWFVTRPVDLATASEIKQVRAAVHTGVRQIPVGRLVIVGDRSRRFPARAGLDPSMTHWEEALDVLDGWVRRRPDLVAGDPRARAAFVARGALAEGDQHPA